MNFFLRLSLLLILMNSLNSYSLDVRIIKGKKVFEKSCINCHNTNHSINFLNKYAFFNNKKMIEHVIDIDYMPPNYIDTTYTRFKNEHVITKEEKENLLFWLKNSKIKYEKFSENTTLNFKPDITVSLTGGYKLSGDNNDHFVLYKIPYEISNDTFVSCIQFVPKNNLKVNHHLNFEILPFVKGMDFKNKTYLEVSKDGFNINNAFQKLGATDSSGIVPQAFYYGSWLPGMTPTFFEKPFSVFLPKKGFIIVNLMHYQPFPIPTIDSFAFNFYFAEPETNFSYKKLDLMVVGSGFTEIFPDFIIEPNVKKTFFTTLTIPEDIIVYSINPHMHKIGKSFIAYATYNNDTLPLIKINNWNFNFQENYVFNNPIVLKANTKIHIIGNYDNTTENAANPFNPPQTIKGNNGMITDEEMLLMGMIYSNINEHDEKFIKYKLQK